MSLYQDYYDLSSEDNDSDGQGSSSSDDDDDEPRVRNRNRNRNRNNYDDNDNDCDEDETRDVLWGRSVVHVDVDCFYVQCEELDRGLRDGPRSDDRPLAIGQKHIVVTCNYAARARGVTKLQSKTEAIRKCPNLWIIDGSDLRAYRNHSRTVYKAFREAVRETIGSAVLPPEASGDLPLPCRRNAMDEMVADLSAAVDRLVRIESSEQGAGAAERLLSGLGGVSDCQTKTYVLGDDASSASARIVEDQSGASTKVVFGSIGSGGDVQPHRDRLLAQSRRNVHEADVRSSSLPVHRRHQYQKRLQQHQHQQYACRKRLELAARLARWICEAIFARTGFHVSAGVSVSPMLAKLSVVEKPRTVNLLLPWRSPELLYSMPLRKLPEVGSRTYRALAGAIAPATSAGVGIGTDKEQGSVVVSVQDLLRAPRDTIVRALRALPSQQQQQQQQQQQHVAWSGDGIAACEQHCDLILQRCRGLDATTVQDDGGGASKTLSVENSFRRGTLTTESCVVKALDELCARLPPLVRDRAEWSKTPSRAYPTTLRLTVRNVVAEPALPRKQSPQSQSQSQRSRRRHVTRSKQTSLGTPRGRLLLLLGKPSASASSSQEEDKAMRMLREAARPLLREFLVGRDLLARIDVTRMNLGVTNFGDAAPMPMPMPMATTTTMMMGGGFLSRSPHLTPATRHCNEQLPSECGSHPAKTVDWNKRSITGRIGLDVPGSHTSNNNGSRASIPNINTNRKRTHAAYSRTTQAMLAPSRRMNDSSSAVRSNTPRKFSRTRIDQFFAKKP